MSLIGKRFTITSTASGALQAMFEDPHGQWAFVDALFEDIPTLHRRRCHDCGHEAWHADSIVPYVLCRKCRSRDTRKVREP